MISRRIVAIQKEVVCSLVGIAVHQVGAAHRSVAPRAANLLVVAFKRRRQPGVNHRADVGLVDAHAEGDGGHHHLQFSSLKCGMHSFPRRRIEPRMVSRGGNSERKLLGQLLRHFARCRINNRRTALGAGQQAADRPRPLRHGKLHHLDGQIVAPEAVNELRGLDHSQLLHNVGLHRWRGRSRQRQHRSRTQRGQVLAEHPVIGTEVVAPLRDAMRLVNGDQRRLALGQHLAEARNPQTLRRNEEELQRSREVIHAGLPRLRPVEAGVNPCNAQSQRRELGCLVFHQSDQRRDDQRRSSQRNRRQLVAERLAKASRHDQNQIAPVNGSAADCLLIGAEARKAEDRAQQLVKLNWLGQRIRIGWSRQ